MITLHIAKLLANAGFGTLDTDIFWEEAPLDPSGVPKNGLWVVTRGVPVARTNLHIQSFDIYARYGNKLTTHQKLESILEYLQTAFADVCTLPTVPPYSTTVYSNVRIVPTSGIDNVGTDEQDKIIKVISGEIRWDKEN